MTNMTKVGGLMLACTQGSSRTRQQQRRPSFFDCPPARPSTTPLTRAPAAAHTPATRPPMRQAAHLGGVVHPALLLAAPLAGRRLPGHRLAHHHVEGGGDHALAVVPPRVLHSTHSSIEGRDSRVCGSATPHAAQHAQQHWPWDHGAWRRLRGPANHTHAACSSPWPRSGDTLRCPQTLRTR